MFAKTLMDSATSDEVMDVTDWPTNIHEYHAMMATAQATAMQLETMQQKKEEVKEEKMDEPE